MLRKRKAQSTLEYIIILTAIVVAVIAGAGLIRSNTDVGLGKLLNQTSQGIIGASQKAQNAINR